MLNLNWGKIALILVTALFWWWCAYMIGTVIGEFRTVRAVALLYEQQVRLTCPDLLSNGLAMRESECIEIFLEAEENR